MKILITGAQGFIGKNLIADLKHTTSHEIMEITRDTEIDTMNEYCMKADFVYHLAGVNRPKDEQEFITGNQDFTQKLFDTLEKHQNKSPVLVTSSIQSEKDNPYGNSKKAAEEIAFKHEKKTGNKVLVYKLPNVFGKWCKPNYNSVVATFCYNIANNLPVEVNDEEAQLNLVYIDDVIQEFKAALEGNENTEGLYCEVNNIHQVKLGEIEKLLHEFKDSRANRSVPNMTDPFTKSLYSTYLSYLSKNNFSYDLKMNKDDRGSFTEFLKTTDRGQVSVNVSKPGITKGNHWHHTKNEKFLVVSGVGVIRFRSINDNEMIEYHVSGDKLEVLDIPVGYTHNIENLGETDMVTVMWVNEIFDPENPDTYFEEV